MLFIRHDWNDAKHKHYGLHGENEKPLYFWKEEKTGYPTSGIRGKRRTSPEDAVRAAEILVEVLLATKSDDRISAAKKASPSH